MKDAKPQTRSTQGERGAKRSGRRAAVRGARTQGGGARPGRKKLPGARAVGFILDAVGKVDGLPAQERRSPTSVLIRCLCPVCGHGLEDARLRQSPGGRVLQTWGGEGEGEGEKTCLSLRW